MRQTVSSHKFLGLGWGAEVSPPTPLPIFHCVLPAFSLLKALSLSQPLLQPVELAAQLGSTISGQEEVIGVRLFHHEVEGMVAD